MTLMTLPKNNFRVLLACSLSSLWVWAMITNISFLLGYVLSPLLVIGVALFVGVMLIRAFDGLVEHVFGGQFGA